MTDDKTTELVRYEERARRALRESASARTQWGSGALSKTVAAPYRHFEARVRSVTRSSHHVLELGAGGGIHTETLLTTGALVTATDISPASVELLRRDLEPRFPGRLIARVADMEALPFEAATFDVVVCAGSLSYGDGAIVDAEVRRVLRPGGTFVCVDSLDHNPIYRFNRLIQYVRGARSWNTIRRMPDLRRIEAFRPYYESVDVQYFGALTWAMPALARLLGADRAAALSDRVDRLLRVRRSAFKFVLVASGRR